MKRLGVVMAAGTLVVLAGCSGEPAPAPPDGPVPFGTHHVDPSDGVPEAQVLGTLKLADGCLMVEFEELIFPLVLPDVATWDEPAQELTINGRTYAMGDEVTWGGGYGSRGDVPATCPVGVETAFVYDAS